MITAEDTARRTPGLANIGMSGQTVRRRLRESGLRDSFGGGSIMVWAGICHVGRTQLKIVQGTLNVVKYGDIFLVISFCPVCNSETLVTSFNMTMQDVTWLVFVKTF